MRFFEKKAGTWRMTATGRQWSGIVLAVLWTFLTLNLIFNARLASDRPIGLIFGPIGIVVWLAMAWTGWRKSKDQAAARTAGQPVRLTAKKVRETVRRPR
jgi:hypothetical protein